MEKMGIICLLTLIISLLLANININIQDTIDTDKNFEITHDKIELTKNNYRNNSDGESPWPMFKQNPQNTGQNINITVDNPGFIRWQQKIGDSSYRSSCIISNNGTIIVGMGNERFDTELYSISSSGIKSLIFFRHRIISGGVTYPPGITSQNEIFFTSIDGEVYYLSNNWSEYWNYSTNSKPSGIVIDEKFAYLICKDGYVYKFSNSGLIWKTDINQTSIYQTIPAIDYLNNIYVFSYDKLVSLYPNGTIRWKKEYHPASYSSPVIDEENNIYFGTRNLSLIALYPNGSIKWEKSLPSISSSISIDYLNKNFIVCCENGQILSLSFSGEKVWNFSINAEIRYSSPIIDGNGIIYIGSRDKNLYAIYPNGTLKWKIKLSDIILNTPAIDYDGNIYISTFNGYLYSIGALKPTIPINETFLPGNKYVNFSWDLPIDDGGAEILNFNVYRNISGTDPEFYTSVSASNLFFNDTDVENGVEYSYWISAVNREGESDLAGPFNATPRGPPSAPRNVSASSGPAYLNISWEGPLSDGGYPIEGYRIYRKEAGIFLLHAETTDHFYIDDVANPGVNYSYYIKAVNQYGESPSTGIFFGMSVGVPPPPDPVSFERFNEAIRIDWSMGLTGLEEYEITKIRIYRDEEVVTEVSTYNNNFNDTGLINGVNYTYQLSGINAAGEGLLSIEYTISPAWIPKPPLNLSVRATSSEVTLSWFPPEDDRGSQIISYRVYRRQIDENWSKVTDLKDMSWTDTDVETGRTYEYAVDCYNEIGPSNMTEKVIITISEQDPPSAPILKEIELTDEGNVHLKWESDGKDEELLFRIYRSTDQDSGFVEIGSTDEYEYLDSEDIEVNSTHYYHVTASDEFGESDSSNVLSIFIEGPSGDEDQNGDDPSSIPFFVIIILFILILAVLGGFFLIMKRKKGPDEEQISPSADQQPLIDDGMFRAGEEQLNQIGSTYEEDSPLVKDYQNGE